MPLSVLISGGGIAGPALAFWLHRHGHATTIVEQAPALRAGGQAVDFRGPSIAVLAKMGFLDHVRAQATDMGPATIVDERGNPIAEEPAEVSSGELEIVWGDLARILHDAVKDQTEYRFGTRIAGLDDRGEKVAVAFDDGSTQTYDLVIGADGLHSGLRALVFGPEEQFVTQLGQCFCYFDIENRLRIDHRGIFLESPGRMAGLQGVDPDQPARAMLYMAAHGLAFDYRDTEGNRRLFAERYAGLGWEVPNILRALATADPVYFDTIAQVHLADYSRGRVALIGDAAWCASPRSGMGTSLAIVGAYVLAHELRAARGDHQAAFTRYQQLLMPYAARCQKLAIDSLKADAPTGPFGRVVRRLSLHALRLPFVSKIVAKRALAVGRSFRLPEYEQG